MAGSNDKRRMLDDEMSRFEAEISGPTNINLAMQGIEVRPIIGSNTFAQVKQQLKQASTDDAPLQPPPAPPNFPNNGPQMAPPFSGPPNPIGQRHGSFGPRMPQPPAFNQDHMRPGPPGPHGPFGPNSGHGGGGGPPNSFPPPPPPPGFMGGSNGVRGPMPVGNSFNHNGMPPQPSPGFIPPQVNRGFMNMGPPMNTNGNSSSPSNNSGNNMGGSIGPRPPPSFLRPPPPPPGLIGQKANGPNSAKGMSNAVISKGPTIISSAPKLYVAQPVKEGKVESEEKVAPPLPPPPPTVAPPPPPPAETKKPVVEPKKKKQKIENKNNNDKKKKDAASQALEMAEKVKQSTTTVKQTVHNVHHSNHDEKKKEKKSKRNLRYAGGQIWEDPCLAEWDPDDFRMFAGDLGNDVTDELLHRYFSHYPSFVKAKVVRDKRTNKSKGYGFISFKDSQDYIRAMKEMNGKYLGSRPIKLRKSMWKDRNLDVVQKKMKEKQLLGLK